MASNPQPIAMSKNRSAKSNDSRRTNRAAGRQRKRLKNNIAESAKGHSVNSKLASLSSAMVDCGWGRLIFAHTFESNKLLLEVLQQEEPSRRDIAFYVQDPHVLLTLAPQEVFLDPSHTYRLDLSSYRTSTLQPRTFSVRRLTSETDAEAVNVIYASRGMVPVQTDFFLSKRSSRAITYFVAEDRNSGEVIGTVTGVDHSRIFNDPEHGASLWCLAVDPQAPHSGIGEALVRRLVEHFHTRGAAYVDLSVMHDNDEAIALYDKLGFRRIQIFAVKRKNPINENLFASPTDAYDALNPYARIIVDEARRRGIQADVIDADGGFFNLSYGGRAVRCRESLSELTSGVAMSICDDKSVTRRLLASAGVTAPAQMEIDDDEETINTFLKEHGRVVVKPARGEQGRGVSVDLKSPKEVAGAVVKAREVCDRVLMESYFEGQDLRLVVIGFKVVAGAIRSPPHVVGDGRNDIRTLIKRQSRRRAAATGGESRIPIDNETRRCIKAAGYDLNDIPREGKEVIVRKTANLHTGGQIHDVTDILHPNLVEIGCVAAQVIDIPVVGIDLMVRAPTEPEYVFIEANERPGLANHEPQPTAECFIDLLFPYSRQTTTAHSVAQVKALAK